MQDSKNIMTTILKQQLSACVHDQFNDFHSDIHNKN